MNHVQQPSTQESPSIVILGARVENGVACDLAEGVLSGVFCFGWELRELVGGGFKGECGCSVAEWW
jgi:hypothetical protein